MMKGPKKYDPLYGLTERSAEDLGMINVGPFSCWLYTYNLIFISLSHILSLFERRGTYKAKERAYCEIAALRSKALQLVWREL